MVKGVTEGFTRELEINGVGYKAEIKGTKHRRSRSASRTRSTIKLPEGIAAKVGQEHADPVAASTSRALGAAAAKIRSFRPPEPYKGKGIKYIEETILRKAGKTAG